MSDQKWFLRNWFVTKGISLAVKSRSDRISLMHYHMQFVCYVPLEIANVPCARALNVRLKNANVHASFTMQFLKAKNTHSHRHTKETKSNDFWAYLLTPAQNWLTNCNALTWMCVRECECKSIIAHLMSRTYFTVFRSWRIVNKPQAPNWWQILCITNAFFLFFLLSLVGAATAAAAQEYVNTQECLPFLRYTYTHMCGVHVPRRMCVCACIHIHSEYIVNVQRKIRFMGLNQHQHLPPSTGSHINIHFSC